jgi:hypothetical protein
MLAIKTRKYPDLTPRSNLRKASVFGVGAAMGIPFASSEDVRVSEKGYLE